MPNGIEISWNVFILMEENHPDCPSKGTHSYIVSGIDKATKGIFFAFIFFASTFEMIMCACLPTFKDKS